MKKDRQTTTELTIPSDVKRYTKVILEAPRHKAIVVYTMNSKEEALKKARRLITWPYKKCVQARDENGRISKGWALVCCK